MIERSKQVAIKVGQEFIKIWSEYLWPTVMGVVTIRPLHHSLTRFVTGIHSEDKVLELGAGYPLYKIYSDKVGDDGLFVALDVNHNIQRRSKKLIGFIDRLLHKGVESRTKLITATVRSLPLADNTFDLVLVNNGPYSTSEVYNVLKPGGRLLVSYTEPFSIPTITSLNYFGLRKNSEFTNFKIFPGAPSFIDYKHPYVAWNWYLSVKKPEAITSNNC